MASNTEKGLRKRGSLDDSPPPGGIEEHVVPGTVHLIDLERKMRAKHAGGDSDIVLVPAPSSDPDDPLNWSPRRKALSTACMSMYTFMIGIASSAIYSVLEPVSQDTGLTLNELNNGTGYLFLLAGWGCLVWQPLALQYGKRPVYLFSMLATLAIMVWTPYTKTNGQYLANKILQGFFAAPIESLAEISVADIYFQHERGSYLGLYSFMLAGSNFFAPVIAGFITNGQGWKWVFYWCAIFLAIGFVFNLILMEETNYDRNYKDVIPSTPPETSGLEKPRPVEAFASPKEKKTYLQKLSVLPQKRPFHLWKMLPRPLILLSFPVILYAGFSYGSNLVWFNVLNGTASSFLSSPPYNFRPSLVGLSYVSPLIGVLLGSLWSGYIGDIIVLRIARRNGGILEPEHRLWLFGLSVVLIPFSLILWGVGAAHGVHWFGLVFAMAVIAASNSISIQLSVSYAIDSYKDLAGEAMVTVILIRNTMSFAIGYGITPWVQGMGKQNAFILAAMVGLAQCLTFLIMVKFGKRSRAKTRERYQKYVQESHSMGMVH